MRPSELSWGFARKSKNQDEFEEFEGGGFGEDYEEELRAADEDDEEEESREIDFEDPNFARGEGIWKNYSEDLDLEE
jgi:hypothetical protein